MLIWERHFKTEEKDFISPKQTDLKGQHKFHTDLLCLYVADRATILASNSVLGTLLSENSLFIHAYVKIIVLTLYYYLITIVNIQILSLNSFPQKLHSAPLSKRTKLY